MPGPKLFGITGRVVRETARVHKLLAGMAVAILVDDAVMKPRVDDRAVAATTTSAMSGRAIILVSAHMMLMKGKVMAKKRKRRGPYDPYPGWAPRYPRKAANRPVKLRK